MATSLPTTTRLLDVQENTNVIRQAILIGTEGIVAKGKSLVSSGLIELVGINETLDQNKWSASATVSIDSAQVSGEIIKARLLMTESGSGALFRQALDLVFFHADPSISANTDHYENSGNEANDSDGTIKVLSSDWLAASSGTDEAAEATVITAFPFITDTSGNLYVSAINRGATSYNSAGGDDEQLRVEFWIRLQD